MRRAAVLLALGAVAVPAASSSPPAITPTTIAGARIGLHAADYKRLLGEPVRKDLLQEPSGWWRLYFTKRRIAVYFGGSSPLRRARLITTWNPAYKTAAGIGPCSPISRLRAVYGSKLKPSGANTIQGKVFAWRLGRLIFAADGRPPHPSKHVTAVGLYSGDPSVANGSDLAYAGFVTLALNHAACR